MQTPQKPKNGAKSRQKIRARRKEGDMKITNYFFLPTEREKKRKFQEFKCGGGMEEMENGKRMRMEQDKIENEEKRMRKEEISNNCKESPTLFMQTDRGQERRQVEHLVIRANKEKARIEDQTKMNICGENLGHFGNTPK